MKKPFKSLKVANDTLFYIDCYSTFPLRIKCQSKNTTLFVRTYGPINEGNRLILGIPYPDDSIIIIQPFTNNAEILNQYATWTMSMDNAKRYGTVINRIHILRDIIKDITNEEADRLIELADSTDSENLTVAEVVIEEKYKVNDENS